jgi:hypothetical protein
MPATPLLGRHFPQKTENRVSKRYLHIQVYKQHSEQLLKRGSNSGAHQRMNDQSVIHLNNGTLFRLRKREKF